MALKDQISALASAVATAINARAKKDLTNVLVADFGQKATDAGIATFQAGQTMFAPSSFSSNWLETGKTYSKASYPVLAAKLGSIADLGAPNLVGTAQLPTPFAASNTGQACYITATDGITTVLVGSGGAIRKTTDGINWIPVPSQTLLALYEVKYLNGNFVSVGNSGTIVTSPDGTNWSAKVAITTNALYGAAYGNGKYVAVGAAGTILYSSDLLTWTVATAVVNTTLNRVVYMNSMFMAVGANGVVLTSTDGVTWTSRTTGQTAQLNDVIYANGVWAVVGAGLILSSTDAITWYVRLGPANALYQVIYANSLFVTVGNGAGVITSIDGVTWTSRTVSPTNTTFGSVCWNGTNYVAVANLGYYYTSSNGTTWTSTFDASVASFYAVSVVNGKTIAFGPNSSVILAGAPRAEVLSSGFWQMSYGAQSATNPRAMAWNGSNMYAFAGTSGQLYTSPDLVTWTGQKSPCTNSFDKMYWLNNQFVCIGGTGLGTNLMTSPDGVTWTTRSTGNSSNYNGISYAQSLWVVVGTSGAIYTSPDLTTWTSRTIGSNQLNDIVYGNATWVTVGASGTVYSSTDGVTWSTRSAGASNFMRVIYANSLFVAVGASGVIYTSTDGAAWTSRTSGVATQLNDVVWNGSLFVAVGASGTITTSPDGVTWTNRSPGEGASSLNAIAWNGTRFVVINTTNGSIWISTNGFTWTRTASTQSNTNTSLQYINGKFVIVGVGMVQYSSDGINWFASDNIQYIPSSINRLYKLGGKYLAATDRGIYVSTDGTSFAVAGRSQPYYGIASIAYSGTLYVAMGICPTGGNHPLMFFKSTDGVTWTKGGEIGTSTATATTMSAATLDVVYANGNFIAAVTASSAQSVYHTIYTSPDGVTWTPRNTPYTSTPVNGMASDGTTVVAGTSNGVMKSIDGGVTWTMLASTSAGANVMYSDGLWVFNLGTWATFTSTDLVSFSNVPYQANITGLLVNGNVVTATGVNGKLYFNKYGPGYAGVPFENLAGITLVSAFKEIPTRGNTALIPVTRNNNIVPNLIMEVPLYSYDPNTSFWIAPSSAPGGSRAYMFAG